VTRLATYTDLASAVTGYANCTALPPPASRGFVGKRTFENMIARKGCLRSSLQTKVIGSRAEGITSATGVHSIFTLGTPLSITVKTHYNPPKFLLSTQINKQITMRVMVFDRLNSSRVQSYLGSKVQKPLFKLKPSKNETFLSLIDSRSRSCGNRCTPFTRHNI
jgi:hypothetical protein